MRAIAQEIRSAWLPLLLGKAFALSCGLLAIPWGTRLIPPDTYAFYSLFLTLIGLSPSVVFAGWVRYVSQVWPTSQDRRSIVRFVLAAIFRQPLLLIALPLLTGAGLAWLHPHAFWPVSILCLVFANTAMLLGTLGTAALQAQKSYWAEFRIALGSASARSFAPLAIAALLGAQPAVLSAGVAAHTAIWVVLLLVVGWSSWRKDPAKACSSPQLPPGSELMLYAGNGLLVWALLVVHRWCAGLLFPGDAAGYFNLAATLSFVIPSTLSATATAIFSPLVYSAASEARTREDWRRIVRSTDTRAVAFFLMAVLAALAVHWIAPFLVGSLISEKYAAAAPWLASIGLYWAAFGAQQYYTLLLQAAGRHRAVLILNALSLLVICLGDVLAGVQGIEIFLYWLSASPLLVLFARVGAVRALLDTLPRDGATTSA